MTDSALIAAERIRVDVHWGSAFSPADGICSSSIRPNHRGRLLHVIPRGGAATLF
jgi:hypothetical protein